MNEILDFSTAYPEILLLVGNETERMTEVTDAIVDILESCGFRMRAVRMADATPEMLLDYYQLIVCQEDAGEGTRWLAKILEEESPDLSHLAYGILSCTDRDEQRKGNARNLDRLLEKLGAVEVVDTHVLNGEITPEHISRAQYWSLDCVAAFSEAFAPAEMAIY